MSDVQSWLKGLRERGYATVMEADEAERRRIEAKMKKVEQPTRAAGLIDPRKINVFEAGGRS